MSIRTVGSLRLRVLTPHKYIHGSGPTSDYLAVSPSYKNPADTQETQGLKLTIDSTAIWNSDGMER